MRLRRTLYIATRNLASHAFRSSLTALGVVFGVGAVVAMMAISEGARIESIRQIAALGIDHIIIRSLKVVSESQANVQSARVAIPYGITAADIAHIGHVFDNVAMVVPVRDVRKPIYRNNGRTDIRVFAVLPPFFDLTRCQLDDARGRFLNDRDGGERELVCMLGVRAARTLFGWRDPLQQSVRIEGYRFRVVGLFSNPYNAQLAGGPALENTILIHYDASASLFGTAALEQESGSAQNTQVEADYLYVKVRDLDRIENTAARLRTYLMTTHKEIDYDIRVPYELLKQREATQRIFSIVMGSIAAISLLVGGIGIMNIMTANVYERTKEIGTRRALGARQRDILYQFLSESILLTVIGGIVGVSLGVGLAAAVTYWAGMETSVTGFSVMISLGVSALVGILFGTYPAWKAATLDPITALRSE